MSHDDFSRPPVLELEREGGDPLRTLSPSAISTLLTCPEKYRQGYMLGNWAKPSGHTVLGNAYHHARRRNYEQKVYSGEDLPMEELLDAYDQGWTLAVERDEVAWRDLDPDATYQLGVAMSRKYHETVSPLVTPVGVEERLEFSVDGVPLVIRGVVDVRTAEMTILDTKTDAKGAKQPKPEWRPQAMIYLAAWPEYDFEWHVHSKGGKLDIWTPRQSKELRWSNTNGRRRAAEMIVAQAWNTLSDLYERYGIHHPWPGNGLVHGFACKGCTHRARCPWWL